MDEAVSGFVRGKPPAGKGVDNLLSWVVILSLYYNLIVEVWNSMEYTMILSTITSGGLKLRLRTHNSMCCI